MKRLATKSHRQPVNEIVYSLPPSYLLFLLSSSLPSLISSPPFFYIYSQVLEKSLHMLEQQYSPLMVLDVLPKLINHASFLMTSCNGEASHLIPKMISEKELIGYCSYYHLLLFLCHHYPTIQERIENQLQLFLQHDSNQGSSIHVFFFLHIRSHYSEVRCYKFGRITCVSFRIRDSYMARYGHCIFAG